MALNRGLKTVAPVLGNLFATILDRTLQMKAWGGAPNPDAELETVANYEDGESIVLQPLPRWQETLRIGVLPLGIKQYLSILALL
ncbi:hypothetical protein Vi05172_g1724 [Venturia inaequalis]|nr:hypothetical protein Vi05172_g1724 [Venturia inaequalis]